MTVGTIIHERHHRPAAAGIRAVFGITFVFGGKRFHPFEPFPVTPRAKMPVGVYAVFTTVADSGKGGDFAKTVFGISAPRAGSHEFGHGLFAFAAQKIETEFCLIQFYESFDFVVAPMERF